MINRDLLWGASHEKEQYKFQVCRYCNFYPCELVKRKACLSEDMLCEQDSSAVIVRAIMAVDECSITPSNDIVATAEVIEDQAGLYDNSFTNTSCTMKMLTDQVECGNKRISEGIGDHYKIEIDPYSGMIISSVTDRWEPSQPVFISAQTGQGKNYFIENTLLPYVRELNIRNNLKQKVLILSNRLALKRQVESHLDCDPDEEKIPYGEFADVMTYQAFCKLAKNLESRQKKTADKYIFVICDEAHFFTSDAMFNPHTGRILESIVKIFKKSIRVYMSATPYECLEYILDEEYAQEKHQMMVFYHFSRDYSYFDVKAYSEFDELKDIVTKSVCKNAEKWLIFIDNIQECEKLKAFFLDPSEEEKKQAAEKNIEYKSPLEGKILTLDAAKKEDESFEYLVKHEKLPGGIRILISTSVIDNGINLTDVDNIVVSDVSYVKVLQMVGRARVNDSGKRKTLYLKRFNAKSVEKRIHALRSQEDAYHAYRMAYGDVRYPHPCNSIREYEFLKKYYHGSIADFDNAKHWFGLLYGEPQLYANHIAMSLVGQLVNHYEYIRDEMQGETPEGQAYLEYQFSWFGKAYCMDDDVTFADEDKAKKEFIAFLESYAESAVEIAGEDMKKFQCEFTKLHDAVYPRFDKNQDREYGHQQMNSILKLHEIGYRLTGRPKAGPWQVVKC